MPRNLSKLNTYVYIEIVPATLSDLCIAPRSGVSIHANSRSSITSASARTCFHLHSVSKFSNLFMRIILICDFYPAPHVDCRLLIKYLTASLHDDHISSSCLRHMSFYCVHLARRSVPFSPSETHGKHTI